MAGFTGADDDLDEKDNHHIFTATFYVASIYIPQHLATSKTQVQNDRIIAIPALRPVEANPP